jgi:hypothetical protein
MREKAIEKKACQRAKDRGWKVRKNSSPSQKGALDRIFHKQGMTCYIEFKAPGGEATELQKIEMAELDDQQIPNACFDNVEDAVVWLDQLDPGRHGALPAQAGGAPQGHPDR